MKRRLRLIAATLTIAAVVAGSPATALASAPFGQMVAMCAQMHLGERANPPMVTCVCNGRTMTFATFGAMVGHMKEMGCTSCASCC